MAIKKASIGMFKYGRFVKRHSVSLKRNLMKDIIASVNAKLIEYLSYRSVKMAKNDKSVASPYLFAAIIRQQLACV